jgi:mannose-6-phosphate isomerase-like protein (cupin superfamily)
MESIAEKGMFVNAAGVQTVSVFGIEVDSLLKKESTDGVFSVYRLAVEPGMGSPLHVHLADEETFYVLEGEFEFLCGEETFRAVAGSLAYLPRNAIHSFRNVGTTRGSLLGIGTPGGHEQFFADAATLPFPPDPADAMAVCQRYNMQLLSAPGAA